MCGVCGNFDGEAHWSQGVGQIQAEASLTRRAERAHRIRIINRVLLPSRVRVSDWQGRFYLVLGPTGKQQVVDSLAHVWQAVQDITGRCVDPLAMLEPATHD